MATECALPVIYILGYVVSNPTGRLLSLFIYITVEYSVIMYRPCILVAVIIQITNKVFSDFLISVVIYSSLAGFVVRK